MREPYHIPKSVAFRLIRARLSAGFATPHAAAVRLGKHPTVYARHEQGKSAVKPDELRRYAETFGVPFGWLSAGLGSGPGDNAVEPSDPGSQDASGAVR